MTPDQPKAIADSFGKVAPIVQAHGQGLAAQWGGR